MIQVKEFTSREYIHDEINKWLEENQNITIKDIKYSLSENLGGALVIYDTNEDMNNNYWLSSNGEKIQPKDMTSKYIKNIMNLLEREYKDNYLDFLIYKLLQLELIERKVK